MTRRGVVLFLWWANRAMVGIYLLNLWSVEEVGTSLWVGLLNLAFTLVALRILAPSVPDEVPADDRI